MKFKDLPETVRDIVQKNAETWVAKNGGSVEEARELIATRVVSAPKHPVKHGTGH